MIETARLRLSAAGAEDIEAMQWLAEALRPEWAPADLMPHVEAGRAALISNRGGKRIGLAVGLAGQPEPGQACVPFLAIEPDERFRGLGGEAGLALERHLRRRWGARRVLAPVPEQRGLAVYFWLRLGFRPLTRSEAPWPLAGLGRENGPGVWMARDPTP